MGLFFADSGGDFQAKSEAALLNQLGCRVCTLNHTPGKIDATGSDTPTVLILGEAPGAVEEADRRHFVGPAGQLLRRYIPNKYLPLLRWNNVINCHPPNDRNPTRQEQECCRLRVVSDIERTKPKAIFGFGNVPLQWACGFSGITYWRGRRMPLHIGKHACWYYPFLHPSFLLRIARGNDDSEFGSEDERMTAFDLERAFADLERLPVPKPHTPDMAKSGVQTLTNLREIESALQWAANEEHIGVDYETNCLRPYESGAKILTGAVGNLNRAFSFPFDHPGCSFTPKQKQQVVDLWRRFLLEAPVVKVVHNLAFEQEWSAVVFGEATIRAQPWEDTATAAAIVDERRGKTQPGCFSLEFLVQQYFGFNVKKVSNVDRKNLADTSLQEVLLYNAIDAKYHDGLWDKLWEEIKAEDLVNPYQLARRRVPAVVLSQVKGVPVDQADVFILDKKYAGKIAAAEKTIAGLSAIKQFERLRGRKFNPHSNPDILFVFDHLLHRPEIFVTDKYTKVKKRSADETVLTQIEHPLATALIDLREASGTKSKYIDSLLLGNEACVLYPDNLIHASFNTYFVETGRLSCSSPNLQNFPKRDAETKEVRRPIHAPKGCVILSVDYGQIEARVIAMFTRDKRFCQALWERYDVHQEWAERIAYDYPARVGGKKNLKDKKIMKMFRTDIKNQWTFPLFFGAKDTSVAGFLQIPLHIIRVHYQEFWRQFEGVRLWQDKQMKFYRQYGYTECLTRRRRHGPMTVNQIYNSPIQGTACEIVMDAMCRLSETGNPHLQPELQIHDDLVFLRVPEKQVDTIGEQVIGMMLSSPFKWINVPITVEMSVGKNWMQLEEVGTFSSDEWNK